MIDNRYQLSIIENRLSVFCVNLQLQNNERCPEQDQLQLPLKEKKFNTVKKLRY